MVAQLVRTAGDGVVLASASRSRRRLLEASGVPFVADPSRVDEDEVKRSLRAEGAEAATVADVLADAKAVQVSSRHPARMVLGADQVLDCDGEHYDKPASRAQAAEQLRALAGRRHRLTSAAVVVVDSRRIWQASDSAFLDMREISDGFIERYLDSTGEDMFASPGAYRVEALGAQLFRRIEGDHFTVLGLPLLPLLDFLRENRILFA